VKLTPHNRWAGFKALRDRWKTHVASSRIRPVLLVDEAQEMSPDVLGELRILSSADFGCHVALDGGPSRRRETLGTPAAGRLCPWGPGSAPRLVTEAASREELLELLRHAISKAGNATLMTAELMDTLVDHSAGNYRLLMIMVPSYWLTAWRTTSRSLTRSSTWRSSSRGIHAPRSRRK